MPRSLVLFVLLAASCKRGGSKPPAAGSGSTSGSGSAAHAGSASASGSGAGSGSGSGVAAAAGPGLAKPLHGPFATLDAYCATRPTTDDHTCDAADTTVSGELPAGLLQAAAVYENNDGPNHDIGCAVALRTTAGWFVGPPSAETCREPSYIELEAIDIDTDGAIAAITFGIDWHTNDGDDEAKYKLTALCGVGRAGTPACTPVFLRQCDAHAPASECASAGFEVTWTIDGDTATFTHSRHIDDETVPTGTQTILGR